MSRVESPDAPAVRAADEYDVFISYCRRPDGEVVQALQRRLEQFANPWYRRHRWRVFHDASSLSAAPDLWDSIERALRRSRWLIIVLSPEAAKSPWIDKEVAWWLANKPEPLRTLLVAIAGGEPPWGPDAPAGEADSILPPALRGSYSSAPRWVDLRPLRQSITTGRSAQQRRQALTAAAADFAAAILEEPKDLLYGAATRRYRRNIRMAVTAAVVSTLAAVAAGYGFVNATQQRRRAEAQTRLAVSRQLIAEAQSMQNAQPGLARQLMAIAYRTEPTDQALAMLVNGPSIPGVLRLSDDVDDLSYSPDGTTLAVSSGRTISLVDVATGAAVSRLGDPGNGGRRLAFSGDGARIATLGTSEIRIWDVRDRARPREIGRYDGAEVGDSDLRLSADGSTIATVETGQTARLFTVGAAGAVTLAATVRGAGTTGSPVMALRDDGQLLALADEEYGIQLFDVANPAKPRRLRTLVGHTNFIESLEFGPGGHVLASGGADDTVRMWSVADPARPRSLSVLVGHLGKVDALAFNAEGDRLASADWTGATRVWDTTDPIRPRLITELSGHSDFIHAVAFSPDSRVLATGSSDDTVRLWTVGAQGTSAPQSALPAPGGHVLAFDPRGPRVIAGARLQQWDLADPRDPQPAGPVVHRTSGPSAAAVSSDGRVLASEAGVEGALLWDISTPGRIVRSGRLAVTAGTISALAFSPADRTLAVAGADIGVLLSDVADPANPGPPRTVPITRSLDNPKHIDGVAFSADGRWLAVTTEAGLEVWDVRDWRRSKPTRKAALHIGPVGAIAFAPDATRLATAGGDGAVRLWADDGDGWRQTAEVTAHQGGVGALAFAPDGRTMATGGSQDATVRLWRTPADAAPTPVTSLSGHAAGISRLAVSPDGRLLVSADIDSNAMVWLLDAPTLLAELCRHSGPKITRDEWRVYVGSTPYEPPCPDPPRL